MAKIRLAVNDYTIRRVSSYHGPIGGIIGAATASIRKESEEGPEIRDLRAFEEAHVRLLGWSPYDQIPEYVMDKLPLVEIAVALQVMPNALEDAINRFQRHKTYKETPMKGPEEIAVVRRTLLSNGPLRPFYAAVNVDLAAREIGILCNRDGNQDNGEINYNLFGKLS